MIGRPAQIKNLYLRTDFTTILTHTCNALHDLTLIKMTVARFVGTGGFLTFWRRIFFFQILAHPVFKM